MIYNLFSWIKDNFTSYEFVVNGFHPESANECIAVTDNGGSLDHYYERTEYTVQILVRTLDNVTGKQRADEIFTFLKNKFHVTLAEVSVNGVVYSAITVAQISPLQTPSALGVDTEGRWLWTFNLLIIM